MSDIIERLRPARTIIRQQIEPALRERIAAAVEQLIAALDTLEPDSDLEPSHGSYPTPGEADEAEAEEPEPSLGSVDNVRDQTGWSAGGVEDMEGDEHDGREPDVGRRRG